VVTCLEGGASDLHMVQLMSLPSIMSYFIKIQIGLTSLVPAYPGCPGKEAVKRVSVFIIIETYLYKFNFSSVSFNNYTMILFSLSL